jgi:ribose transport system ATP-binding protein
VGRRVVEMSGMSKRFAAVIALQNVDFDLYEGEVHVLVGENGAGKSTLMKVLAGSYRPDKGEIYIGGKKANIRSPSDSRQMGICLVYQELSLIPAMRVWENLFVGREELKKGLFINKRAMIRQAEDILSQLSFPINPKSILGQLSLAERQMIEIAKAFIGRMRVLILDEPTASLTDKEVEKLFQSIAELKSQGVGIVYISHRLEELERVGDRVTVLRDGRKIETINISEASPSRLINLMTGKAYTQIYPKCDFEPQGEEILRVESLCAQGIGGNVTNVSFSLNQGEILAFGGLIGSGKEVVGRALFGLEQITSGSITLKGKKLRKGEMSPSNMIKMGVMYFPADRYREGLVLCRPLFENVTLSALSLFEKRGLLAKKREKEKVLAVTHMVEVRPWNIKLLAQAFSGGNQQKIVFCRGLIPAIEVFIFDEISRGVDIGSKIQLYGLVHDLARIGKAVLFISSELPEVLHLPHRIIAMHQGTIAADLPASQTTAKKLLNYYFRITEEKNQVDAKNVLSSLTRH